jgi:hypothetical protein
MPDRSEQIVYITEWAAKNRASLQLNGQVGIGRDCVGVHVGGTYIDTAEAKEQTCYRQDGGPWWEPGDSYHKHDCLAVLGHGDAALAQLYEWVRWLDAHGYGVEEACRQPSSNIDLVFHGISLPKLVKLNGATDA